MWSVYYVGVLVVGAESSVEIVVKAYNESITLPCPGCDVYYVECPAIINGIGTSLPATNGSIVLPPHNWDVFGDVCCGTTNQPTCYTVCLQHDGKKSYLVTQ